MLPTLKASGRCHFYYERKDCMPLEFIACNNLLRMYKIVYMKSRLVYLLISIALLMMVRYIHSYIDRISTVSALKMWNTRVAETNKLRFMLHQTTECPPQYLEAIKHSVTTWVQVDFVSPLPTLPPFFCKRYFVLTFDLQSAGRLRYMRSASWKPSPCDFTTDSNSESRRFQYYDIQYNTDLRHSCESTQKIVRLSPDLKFEILLAENKLRVCMKT